MAFRVSRVALVPGFVIMAAACSGDRVSESVGQAFEALSTNDRILDFEGSVGGSTGDWHATTGTATSSTLHSSGSKSISLGSNWNPAALSAVLSALGPLSAAPGVDVELPTSYVSEGSYNGQIALFLTCGTNFVNQYVGPVSLGSTKGSFAHYVFPALPAPLATALSTQNGCTVTVQLNLSNSGTVPVLVDHLSFGQSSGSGGTGGSAGTGGSGQR